MGVEFTVNISDVESGLWGRDFGRSVPAWVLHGSVMVFYFPEADYCSNNEPTKPCGSGWGFEMAPSLFSQTSGKWDRGSCSFRAEPGNTGWVAEIIHGQEQPGFCILAFPHLNGAFTLYQVLFKHIATSLRSGMSGSDRDAEPL